MENLRKLVATACTVRSGGAFNPHASEPPEGVTMIESGDPEILELNLLPGAWQSGFLECAKMMGRLGGDQCHCKSAWGRQCNAVWG